jgi:hypothetical protein
MPSASDHDTGWVMLSWRVGRGAQPHDQMQLALALAQLWQTQDMIRAQDTLIPPAGQCQP